MDVDKIGQLLEESKGADVGFYLLLGFSCVCPGFLVLFTYRPDIVQNYDLSKLILFCISISGLSVVLFLTHIWMCALLSGGQLSVRVSILMASSLSTVMMVLSLKSPDFRFYAFSLQFYWGLTGFIASIVIASGKPWYLRFIFNYGALMFLLVILSLAEQITAKEFFQSATGPWLKHVFE